MRKFHPLFCVITGLLGAPPAFGQAGHGTPMVGWSCRMLNLTAGQSMDFSIHIPVRTEPNDASPLVGYASETVAVKSSAPIVNGFIQAMFPTGRQVWIAASALKAWHAAANPAARCVPVIKANGKPGFDYPQ